MSAAEFEFGHPAGSGEWVPMAGWGVRVVARILDQLLEMIGSIPYALGLLLVLTNRPTGTVTPGAPGTQGATVATVTDPGAVILGSVLMLVGLGMTLALFIWNRVLRQGRTGQSVGKAALNLYLVSATTGQPVGAGTSFAREIVHLVDGILYLGYLWPLWDPRRQTFADKILNTVVAHPQKRPSVPEFATV
ncbi:MAG TPA: RDD family protein [Pedococcus sp.]|nr:RDD family protein [Pedococcus sp.]